MAKLANTTQRLANSFPPWSATRQDEQSLGFQFLNVLGVLYDDLWKQVITLGHNYFIPTANIDDIDVTYKFKLPDAFTFNVDVDQDGIEIPQFPTVSGLVGSIYREVSTLNENNLEAFWYRKLPDRGSLDLATSGQNHLLTQQDVSTLPIVASGAQFTYSGLSHIIEDDTRLWVTVSGITNALDIKEGQPVRGLVRLDGISRGRADTEYIVFLYDQTIGTMKEWEQLLRLEAYNIEPPTAEITVRSGRFNSGPYRDFWNREVSKDSKENIDVFWDVENYTLPGYSYAVLNKYTHQVDELGKLIDGLADTQIVRRIELLDESGNAINPVKDLAVQPFSNRVWVLGTQDGTGEPALFVYDKGLPVADVNQLKKKNFDAVAIIEASSNYVVRGEDVELSYFWIRPTQQMLSHRVYVDKPDGTRRLIVDGVEETFTTGGGYGIGSPTERRIRPTDIFTLTQVGDYIYTLETNYQDGVKEHDQRIVSVVQKRALASFVLSDIDAAIDAGAQGIDFDSRHRLWLANTSGDYWSIKFHYDVALVDFKTKTIYCREPYDQVRVNPDQLGQGPIDVPGIYQLI